MNEKEKSVQAVLDKSNYRASVLKHQNICKLPLYNRHKTCVLVNIHVKKNLNLPWSPIVFNPTKYLLLITNLLAMF